MAITARELIQELGFRLDDCFTATATSSATVTTIIDTGLRKFFPVDGRPDQWTPWVYANTGTAQNIVAGVREQRARMWSAESSTLTLFAPGYPAVTTQGDTFELHFKTRRSRKLAAINDAVKQLGLVCRREFCDESLTTLDATYSYTLPSSQNWRAVRAVEIQVSGTTPYADASDYGWDAVRTVSTAGVESWALTFKHLPPVGKILKVWGEGYYPDLTLDADTLALAGDWGQRALVWIYEWGKYQLSEEITFKKPEADAQKWKTASYSSLKKALDDLIRLSPDQARGRVVVPDMTGGYSLAKDLNYFGSGNTPS